MSARMAGWDGRYGLQRILLSARSEERIMNFRQKLIDLAYKSPFQGHINIGRKITIYGFNAMWLMVQIYTRRWGYICFRPPNFHPIHGWCFYCSPNGTPWAATFMLGGRFDKREKERSRERRLSFGHNFDVDGNYQDLRHINDQSFGELRQP